jgi:hypothetical protein
MSSTIIPGVSNELGVNYLMAFNTIDVKYMFTVSCSSEIWETPCFPTCFEANDYADTLSREKGFDRSKVSIFLNQINGSRLLSQDEVISLAAFETDDQLYSIFQMYAEKMSRPGRLEAREEQDEDEEDYEQDYEQDYEEEERPRKEVNWVRWAQEREHLETPSIEEDLSVKLHDANKKIAKLEKQLEKTRREMAMEWIISMKPEEFEQRLLTNSANYKLPDFPRAQPGDEDYPDLTKLERQIAAPYYKYALLPEEHEHGKTNYACSHRKDLLYMSQEEFRACAYEEVEHAVYNGSWPPISHTRVSDFDVYG